MDTPFIPLLLPHMDVPFFAVSRVNLALSMDLLMSSRRVIYPPIKQYSSPYLSIPPSLSYTVVGFAPYIPIILVDLIGLLRLLRASMSWWVALMIAHNVSFV